MNYIPQNQNDVLYVKKVLKLTLPTRILLTRAFRLESVQDFLIKLDIKPQMHLLEISTFSLNNVIVRLTKIMNRADKNWAHF